MKCNAFFSNADLEDLPPSDLHHLKWMMQKDILGQDIFLLGSPGSRKRTIAMQYLELINKEYEYIAITRDTSESDLKQRKEIVEGVAKYCDQVRFLNYFFKKILEMIFL